MFYNIHCVSKKVPTLKLFVTLSNLNRFSKFLHCWKAYEIRYSAESFKVRTFLRHSVDSKALRGKEARRGKMQLPKGQKSRRPRAGWALARGSKAPNHQLWVLGHCQSSSMQGFGRSLKLNTFGTQGGFS